ncbi:MAG: hypothetical protein HRT37_16660 [Alteromonadaceae bacterium]|nr:hypothetical protein [Alteromonadaceae bacterium]
MLGIKSTFISIGVGLLATLFCYSQWQAAKNETAMMLVQLQASEQLVTSQKEALKEQGNTLETFKQFSKTMQQQNDNLSKKRDDADAKTEQALQIIADLRASEKSAALQNPYLRGNFARDRLVSSMQRITGETHSNSQDPDNTRITGASTNKK